ncbi:MAG: DNA translocase FtsK 4TM domain-containing protein [Bacteroidota bacterium]
MTEKEETIIANQFKRTRPDRKDDEFTESKEKKHDEKLNGKEFTNETNREDDNVKRKKKIPKQKTNFFQPFISFLKNKSLHNVLGLSLLLASVYMLIAFSSFLITWQTDQDKVMGSWYELFFSEDDINIDNWLGKFGAVISHVFIHNGFGITSFIFVALSFLAGFRILFNISLFPLRKFFKRAFFMIFWLSVSIGFVFQSKYFFLGGTFGYQSSLWLSSALGTIGTGFLLVFIFLGFIAISFNYSFNWIKNKNNNSQIESLDDLEQLEDLPTENIEIETSANEEKKTVTFEMDLEKESEKKSTDSEDGDVQFVVEKSNQEIIKTEETEEDLSVFGEFDPTLELSDYQRPSIDLLKEYGNSETNVNEAELIANKDRIVSTLRNFGIEITKIKATIGPTVTLYEIIPAEGVRISKIKNLEDDIALSLAALGIRIIAPMPGKGTIGIEVPNQNPEIVSMRSVIASEKFQNTNFELPFGLGKTITNETYIADLTKMPHLLIAGATGQGKSVGLNAILTSFLYKKHPAQVKFVLVDPKRVELTLFNKIERHFLAKLPNSEDAIITDTTKVIHTLKSLCMEMDDRLTLFNQADAKNIKEYNTKFINRKLNPKKGHKYLPYIVVVVDEFGDLIATSGKEVEMPLTRLAAIGRAPGIHLIIATQRPSVNVVTGLIKANFPARIAFRVQAKVDSRTILDAGGADQLVGKGDMLFSMGSELIRLQCPFVDTPEVESITEFIGSQRGYPETFKLPEYVDENTDELDNLDPAERDDFFADAAHIVVTHQQGSASLLQRKLKLGYNRAGRIIDQLEAAGIIGPFKGSKAREVLVSDIVTLEQFLNKNISENQNDSSNE